MLGPREKSQKLAKFLRIPVVKKRHWDRMEDRAARRLKDSVERDKFWSFLLDNAPDGTPLRLVQKEYLKGSKVEPHKRGTK